VRVSAIIVCANRFRLFYTTSCSSSSTTGIKELVCITELTMCKRQPLVFRNFKMSKNHENQCLSDSQLLGSFINHKSVESFLWKYLFPPVFLIGLFGNLIDLFVLFSPRMRNRANYLLSALGLADLTFLLVTLPHCLANYTTFALNFTYRYFYFHAKIELMAMANWSSTAAIW
jgi:hypothetical protein